MTADAGVRQARPEDAAAIARVQLAGWRTAYADVLPADTLAALRLEDFTESWRVSLEHPPTPRHRALAALAGDAVVGFAAIGPALDEDRDAHRDGELYTLLVDPDAQGSGHGSRLLAASVDRLRDDGFATAVSWLLTADERLAAFLLGAGWAPDGSRRDLDIRGDGSATVPQVRFHTGLA